MFSKPLAFGLLALSCVTAAAGGAYLATRHNAADAVVTPPHVATAPANAAPAHRTLPPVEKSWPTRDGAAGAPPQTGEAPVTAAPAPAASGATAAEPPRQPEPAVETPRAPQFEDLVLPASSVIGLQIQTPLS